MMGFYIMRLPYLNEGNSEVISLMEDDLLQPRQVVHDERLLARIDQIDAVAGREESHSGHREEIAEPACHHKIIF